MRIWLYNETLRKNTMVSHYCSISLKKLVKKVTEHDQIYSCAYLTHCILNTLLTDGSNINKIILIYSKLHNASSKWEVYLTKYVYFCLVVHRTRTVYKANYSFFPQSHSIQSGSSSSSVTVPLLFLAKLLGPQVCWGLFLNPCYSGATVCAWNTKHSLIPFLTVGNWSHRLGLK